tara:strand:- start:623 stop:1186 length:564 start_codon:yes stop_codon:yes gene_type:complete
MYDNFYGVFLPQPLIWKPVKSFEGLYEVSNYGNIRSLDRLRTWVRKDDNSLVSRVFKGKEMTLKLKATGYKEVHLRDEDRSHYWTVHKVVSEAFHDNLTLPVIDHKDDDKTHNTLWNLQRCTVKFNTEKAYASGKLVAGNDGYKRKLSDEIKNKVKDLLSENVSIRAIERELGVSQRSIARIRDGEI